MKKSDINETPLTSTRLNKGAVKRLHQMGIFTLEQLKYKGAATCYLEMKKRFSKLILPKCYNLYDLQAVIDGNPKGWKGLTDFEKSQLSKAILLR